MSGRFYYYGGGGNSPYGWVAWVIGLAVFVGLGILLLPIVGAIVLILAAVASSSAWWLGSCRRETVREVIFPKAGICQGAKKPSNPVSRIPRLPNQLPVIRPLR